MFDVGLTELMVIAVVALVVIGPERLPKVARTAGLLLGRLQRYVSDVKADINREMQLDELKKMQQQVSSQVNSLETSVTHEMREVESRWVR
jgi:sec-independent protein translocase protein TatB